MADTVDVMECSACGWNHKGLTVYYNLMSGHYVLCPHKLVIVRIMQVADSDKDYQQSLRDMVENE
jgi:hypothetical protein